MRIRGTLTAYMAILALGETDAAVAQPPHQFTGVAAYYSTEYSAAPPVATSMIRRNSPRRTVASPLARACALLIPDRNAALSWW
jgi:hypothetical protein